MSQTSWKPLITTNNSKITPLEMKEDIVENILFMGINTDSFFSQPSNAPADIQQYLPETSSTVIGMLYVAKNNNGPIEIQNNIPVYRHTRSNREFYYSFFPVNSTDVETNVTSEFHTNLMDMTPLVELLDQFQSVYNKVNIAANVELRGINDFKEDDLVAASDSFWRSSKPPVSLPQTSFVPTGNPRSSLTSIAPPSPSIAATGPGTPQPPPPPSYSAVTSSSAQGVGPVAPSPEQLKNEADIAQHLESHGIYWNPVSTTSVARPQKGQSGGGIAFTPFIQPLRDSFLPVKLVEVKKSNSSMFVHHLFGIFTTDMSLVSDNKKLPELAKKLKEAGAKPLKQSGLPSHIVQAFEIKKGSDGNIIANTQNIKYFTTNLSKQDGTGKDAGKNVINKRIYTLYEIQKDGNTQEFKSLYSKKQEIYDKFQIFLKHYASCGPLRGDASDDDDNCMRELSQTSKEILEMLPLGKNKPKSIPNLTPQDIQLLFLTIGNYMLINSIFAPNYKGQINISNILDLAADITRTSQSNIFKSGSKQALISGGSATETDLPRIIFSRNQKRRIEKKGLNLELVKKMYYNHILTEEDIDNLKNAKVLSNEVKSEIVRRINSHLSHIEEPDIEIQSAIPAFENNSTETNSSNMKNTTYKKQTDMTLPSLSKTRRIMRGGSLLEMDAWKAQDELRAKKRREKVTSDIRNEEKELRERAKKATTADEKSALKRDRQALESKKQQAAKAGNYSRGMLSSLGIRSKSLEEQQRKTAAKADLKAATDAKNEAKRRHQNASRNLNNITDRIAKGDTSPEAFKELNDAKKEYRDAKKERSQARDLVAKKTGMGARAARTLKRMAKSIVGDSKMRVSRSQSDLQRSQSDLNRAKNVKARTVAKIAELKTDAKNRLVDPKRDAALKRLQAQRDQQTKDIDRLRDDRNEKRNQKTKLIRRRQKREGKLPEKCW